MTSIRVLNEQYDRAQARIVACHKRIAKLHRKAAAKAAKLGPTLIFQPVSAAVAHTQQTAKVPGSSDSWFHVDRDGFAEMHSAFPLERMVAELVQNVWDEDSKTCTARITQEENETRIEVQDDNPQGFTCLADAYTLYRSTKKRSNATKRGRFNLGEKIVLSRAKSASIATTTGTVRFGDHGRSVSEERTQSGSVVSISLPKVEDCAVTEAMAFLGRLIPPDHCTTTFNGVLLQPRTPSVVHDCSLPTEVLAEVQPGIQRMTKTNRKTTLTVYPQAGPQPMIYEMGLPICVIEGVHDLDVGQKCPVSADRTTLSLPFLREVYAELLNAIRGSVDVERMGVGLVKMALESDRVDAATTAVVFHQIYGPTAVIQSNEPDSDQEAARHGRTIVSTKTFGGIVNKKLKSAGVKTSHDEFSHKITTDWTKLDITIPTTANVTPLANFVGYVRMLEKELYGASAFEVSIAEDLGTAEARNVNRDHIVFSASAIKQGINPVSKWTSLILHEMAHCKGAGHDGVYDHEFERLVDRLAVLIIQKPYLFTQFEPEILRSC